MTGTTHLSLLLIFLVTFTSSVDPVSLALRDLVDEHDNFKGVIAGIATVSGNDVTFQYATDDLPPVHDGAVGARAACVNALTLICSRASSTFTVDSEALVRVSGVRGCRGACDNGATPFLLKKE